jgi:UDP-glucose 4-epimerase
MNIPTVLVTGGCGFIGSHLVEKLLSEGYFVRVLDDLSTGKLSNLSKLSKKKLEIVIGCVSDFNTVRNITQGCTYIFHEAAITSVNQSILDPVNTSSVNYGGTINILEASRQCGVKRVVFASSAAVYGDIPTLPKHEEMIANPISPYGVDKLASEFMGKVYTQISDIEFVSLRYFNVFGPRQTANSAYAGVISMFCDYIQHNIPPTIYGDGMQSRDFIYVSDIVSANLLAMKLPVPDQSNVFNVGRGTSITLLNLIDILNQLTSKNIQCIHKPSRTGDIRHSVADISKLQSFKWMPNVSIYDGLVCYLEYLQSSS